VSTEWDAVLVIAACLASLFIVVGFVVADGDHGDDAVIVERVKTALEATGRVSNVFTNAQLWQVLAEMSKMTGHNDAFISICRLG
jgi:hypothetical protein